MATGNYINCDWGSLESGSMISCDLVPIASNTLSQLQAQLMPQYYTARQTNQPQQSKLLFHRCNDEVYEGYQTKEPLDELRIKVSKWLNKN